jgi:hypothetical protein
MTAIWAALSQALAEAPCAAAPATGRTKPKDVPAISSKAIAGKPNRRAGNT